MQYRQNLEFGLLRTRFGALGCHGKNRVTGVSLCTLTWGVGEFSSETDSVEVGLRGHVVAVGVHCHVDDVAYCWEN